MLLHLVHTTVLGRNAAAHVLRRWPRWLLTISGGVLSILRRSRLHPLSHIVVKNLHIVQIVDVEVVVGLLLLLLAHHLCLRAV